MQDDFDSGLGMPEDELTGGTARPEMGVGGGSEPEMGGPEGGRRASGGARARKSSGGSRKSSAPKRAKKKARKSAIEKAAKTGKDIAEAASQFDPGEKPQEPRPRRYLVNDSTVEKLGEHVEG